MAIDKFEARNQKFETMTKNQKFSMTKTSVAASLVFEIFVIWYLSLFRVSIFEFLILNLRDKFPGGL